jgi:hypothetical protein
LIQECCSRMIECFELLHSRVLECLIKVKLSMTTQGELLQFEYTGWIAEWPNWKLFRPGNNSADEKNGSMQGIKDMKEFKDNQLQHK